MKLPTKILLIFAIVFLAVTGWIMAWAIPTARHYLVEREVIQARTNLEMASHEIRVWLDELESKRLLLSQINMSKADYDAMATEMEAHTYRRLNELYAKFYFHDSGRLFVINPSGEFVIAPQQRMRGRTISTRFMFEEGTRDKLMQQINANSAQIFQEYHLEELDADHNIVQKSLFISIVPGSDLYICLAVDDEDLYFSSNMVTRSLVVLLLLTMTLLLTGMYWVFTRIRPRYNTLIDSTRQIASGHYEVVINDKTPDEIGHLSRTIDTLAASLRDKEVLERQLRQMQKMELMGSMASGIAHEFNNILGGIRASVDFCLEELKDDNVDLDMLRTTLSVTNDCAVRGRDTVERMVAFSRETESHRKLRDLNKILRNVGEICRHSFDKRITVEIEPWDGDAVVRADRSQLEQVILNLCVNARDAMPEGGEIRISLSLPEGTLISPLGQQAEPGNYFCLTIADNGSGMPPEILSRIFDPYFTTKELATGLGLSIVYKIVDEHDGWIDTQSRKGFGTTFRIYLPRLGEHLPHGLADSGTLSLASAPPGSAILVADSDGYTVQNSLAQLTKFGHHVTGSVGGPETLRVLSSLSDPLNLVIVDLFMRDLDVDAFFETLKENHSGCRILITTGNKRDPRIADMLARGCDSIIHKPYTQAELLSAVNQVLQPPDVVQPATIVSRAQSVQPKS